jgi:transposase InsO family protein
VVFLIIELKGGDRAIPFRESNRVEERIALLRDFESGAFAVSDLCHRHGISRETFYVWHRRRAGDDERWFEERSRAPGRCPHANGSDAIAAIVAMRERFPHFGPKKIKARLALDQPDVAWPAASTIDDIPKREGLVVTRSRRRRPVD